MYRVPARELKNMLMVNCPGNQKEGDSQRGKLMLAREV